LGKKYVHLVVGSTIYILLMLAGLNLRWCVTRISWHTIFNLGKMLRDPVTTGTSKHLYYVLVYVRLRGFSSHATEGAKLIIQ
ncbi:hypothetical protein SCLCIDRAFT_115218, partial [Scleroderma citrinum Foug A]